MVHSGTRATVTKVIYYYESIIQQQRMKCSDVDVADEFVGAWTQGVKTSGFLPDGLFDIVAGIFIEHFRGQRIGLLPVEPRTEVWQLLPDPSRQCLFRDRDNLPFRHLATTVAKTTPTITLSLNRFLFRLFKAWWLPDFLISNHLRWRSNIAIIMLIVDML